MKRFTSLVAFLICATGHTQESTVTVLAVELPPGGYAATIIQQMGTIAANWPNPNGVTITLVNNGAPIYLGTGIGSGDIYSQLTAAKNGVVDQDRRGVADIVVFFSPYVTDYCGLGEMDNWNGDGRHQFIADENGLDLDGKDTYYAAIVKIGCAGSIPEAALYEVGHLFGLGHAYWGPGASPYGYWLLPDNHAWWWYDYYYGGAKTIMAQGDVQGTQQFVFSSNFYTNTDNLSGLTYTARSVANYRTGVAEEVSPLAAQCSDGVDNDGNALTDYPNDPGCSGPNEQEHSTPPQEPNCGLTAPVVVSGMVTGVCAPPPYTEHYIWWTDVCPSASTHYEVWYTQNYSIYYYGWSKVGPQTYLQVAGPHADIKIKACNGGVCSGLSADSYFAYSQC